MPIKSSLRKWDFPSKEDNFDSSYDLLNSFKDSIDKEFASAIEFILGYNINHFFRTQLELESTLGRFGQKALFILNGDVLQSDGNSWNIIDNLKQLNRTIEIFSPPNAGIGTGLITNYLSFLAAGQYNIGNPNTRFEVGNGISNSSRSNALEVYQDGSVIAPSLSENLITYPRSLITKEYFESNASKSELEKITENGLSGWRLLGEPSGHDAMDTHKVDLSGLYDYEDGNSIEVYLQQTIQNPTNSHSDNFGDSVSLYQDTLVIGAPNNDTGAEDAGTVYVYIRSGYTWSLQQTINNPTPAQYVNFGGSVSLYQDTLVIGAPNNDTGATEYDAGSVYVYTRSGTTWALQQTINNPGPDPYNDRFGYSISLYQDTLVIGAPWDDAGAPIAGSAYVYVRSGTTWFLQQTINNPSPGVHIQFGWSVSLYQDTLVVGDHGDYTGNHITSSVYVYTRSGTSWALQQTINNPSPSEYDEFGYEVSLYEDTLVVGAPYDDAGASGAGSVYVYVRSGSTWTLRQEINNPTPGDYDGFGYAVSLYGDSLVVGAWDDSTFASNEGSAYVYTRSGTTWTLVKTINNPRPVNGDEFGEVVFIYENSIVISSPYETELVYTYKIENSEIFPDSQGYSTVLGTNSSAQGFGSITLGLDTISKNRTSISIGRFNEGVKDDTILEVGIGNSEEYRKNALEVYQDGRIISPFLDVSLITDPKSLITKEYLEFTKKFSNIFYAPVFSNIINFNGGGVNFSVSNNFSNTLSNSSTIYTQRMGNPGQEGSFTIYNAQNIIGWGSEFYFAPNFSASPKTPPVSPLGTMEFWYKIISVNGVNGATANKIHIAWAK